jgi:hypothetical protein
MEAPGCRPKWQTAIVVGQTVLGAGGGSLTIRQATFDAREATYEKAEDDTKMTICHVEDDKFDAQKARR